MSVKKMFGLAMIPASAFLLVLGLGGQACSEGSDDPASDGDSDGDADTDTDGDGDTDTDSGSDGDTDTDTDADTDADADLGEIQYGFDADVEGFEIIYSSPAELADISTLAFDDSNGSPDPGSLALTTTFSDAGQNIDVGINLAAPVDLGGKMITVKINLPEALTDADLDAPNGAKLYLKTTDTYIWGDGGWANLVPGDGWATVVFDVDFPSYSDAGYDPTQVYQIGIEFMTNGTAAGTYNEGTILIDSIAW